MTLELVSMKEQLEKGAGKPLEPIVGGLLFRKSLAVLGAPDDSFKTHWALQLAISCAARTQCYSYSCKGGSVVYLVLEGGADYILERLEGKIDALRLNRDEIMGRIYVQDCSGVQLDNDQQAGQLEEAILAIHPSPDLVVFDPITYALNEDVRFSPEKSKLCRNFIGIAEAMNGVILAVVHCRKDAQDNDNMDDFLGSGVLARAAATRIKLYRQDDNRVNMYVKTRYAERPDTTSLIWRYPLLEVLPEALKPRDEAKSAILGALKGSPAKEEKLGDLIMQVAEKTKHNHKTVRAALSNLEVEGKVKLYSLPGSAIKVVKLVGEEVIYAS